MSLIFFKEDYVIVLFSLRLYLLIMASNKKKITQNELRRLMNEQKMKLLNNVKRIESPLARYDDSGTLHCIVCDTVVRSEAVWSVHLNSKNHKQNILNKIKKKEEPPKVPEVVNPIKFKRPASSVPVPSKKLKGILKNSPTSKDIEKSVKSSISFNKIKLVDDDDYEDDEDEGDNFNDNKNCNSKGNEAKDKLEEEKNDGRESELNQDVLPEGFFDDPKLDAKVRNVEYKDPIEEEWEQFQKEIKEETSKAQQIIAEDQEEATTERQIDEIDEQIRNWSRVVNLEKKKEYVSTTVCGQKTEKNEEYSEDEDEFEEFLDWRSKKSFEHKSHTGLPIK